MVLSPAKPSVLRVCKDVPGLDLVFQDVTSPAELRSFESAADAFERHGCSHVIATSESNMLLAGRLREHYSLPGLKLGQSLAVTDKREMHHVFSPVVPMAPRWTSDMELEGGTAFSGFSEFIVKPALGSSSRGVERHSMERLLEVISGASDDQVVEAALDVETELHCDGVLIGGELAAAAVSKYDRPVLEARGNTRASIHLPEEHEMSRRARLLVADILTAAPNLDGVFHIELLVVDGAMFLGEIAMRPAGGGVAEALRRHKGLDLWDAFIRAQLGMPLPTPSLSRVSPATPWAGVLGVVPSANLSRAEQRAFLLRQPEVVSLEELDSGESRPKESCSFSWHAFFQTSTESQAYSLTERISKAI
ncbi:MULTISPECIES: hypothetical protein [unclassified Paenarthrobacter]|uniref:ATP-grasp domain-containing protein n=2 Tax=Paenarthrobacter TaxID=1742992 RepID=UPI001F190371|nr:hypothetical protein [Paenarthrobacter sp. AR 02]